MSEDTAHTQKNREREKKKYAGDHKCRHYFKLVRLLEILKAGRMGSTGIIHCSNMQGNT